MQSGWHAELNTVSKYLAIRAGLTGVPCLTIFHTSCQGDAECSWPHEWLAACLRYDIFPGKRPGFDQDINASLNLLLAT